MEHILSFSLIICFCSISIISAWDIPSIPSSTDDPRLNGMTSERIKKVFNYVKSLALKDYNSLMVEYMAYLKKYQRDFQIRNPIDKFVRDVLFGNFGINKGEIDKQSKAYKEGKGWYELGTNSFTDQDNEVFTKARCGIKRASNQKNENSVKSPGKTVPAVSPAFTGGSLIAKRGVDDLPDSFSWTKRGAVNPVRDQGQCGSCYAFSIMEALSGAYFVKYKQLKEFSQQYIVDCTGSVKNNGCESGDMGRSFDFIMQKGIVTAKEYPYTEKKGECQKKPVQHFKARLDSVISNDEKDLKRAIYKYGPVTVEMDASSWQHYHQGVFYDPKCSATTLNHGVVVTGWGIEKDGKKYWEVKNSWGDDWGVGGFIKIARDMGNQCGIASVAKYVVFN